MSDTNIAMDASLIAYAASSDEAVLEQSMAEKQDVVDWLSSQRPSFMQAYLGHQSV